jgi:GntR family transcriptional regulator
MLPASVGRPWRSVNLHLMSYIRHITYHFLLDDNTRFVVKSGLMSSTPSNSTNNGVPSVAAGIPAAGTSPTFSPLYQQIKALITKSLQSGEWKPGELIPSEVELANRFKVSQGTVRKAIDELAAENLVVRRQGKGTFVATHHEARAQFRFLRLMPDIGEPHYADNQILDVKRLRAPAEVARLLDIKSGDSVVFIKRVQSFDAAPTIVEELWLPGVIFKGLTAERLDEYKGPMYGLFETEFGTRMIRASEKIRAVAADESTAELLKISVNTPLLSVERVSYTYGDKPVEVRRGLYLTEHHHYQNELS